MVYGFEHVENQLSRCFRTPPLFFILPLFQSVQSLLWSRSRRNNQTCIDAKVGLREVETGGLILRRPVRAPDRAILSLSTNLAKARPGGSSGMPPASPNSASICWS